MIIVNQDKTSITNFDNINTLRTTKAGRIISFDNSYRASEDCSDILGRYKTEERAKEVINKINEAYSDFEYYKYADASERNEKDLKKFKRKNLRKQNIKILTLKKCQKNKEE